MPQCDYIVPPRVEKSDYFTRKGADVHTEAHISLAQVLCFCDHTVSVSVSVSLCSSNMSNMDIAILQGSRVFAETFLAIWISFRPLS